MQTWPKDRSDLYGMFAYASVILSCYAGYSFHTRFFGPPWAVLVSFALGALYLALAILGDDWFKTRGRWGWPAYFAIQCAIVTAAVWLSPLRGSFGILVLPLASHSVFVFGWRGATVVVAYLYLVNIAVWGIPFGWASGVQALVSYAAAFVFTIIFTIITKQALAARERAEILRRELETANAQLRSLAEQADDLATTRERNRLAREIHDGVGHYLTVVKTQLDAAAALLEPGATHDTARAREAVTKAARLALEALDDVRRSVGTLRADAARPLPEALRELAAEVTPVPEFRIEGTPRPLSPAAEHALFRSAQEGLTNVRKHARASAATVVLDFRPADLVRLELRDNGAGVNGSAGRGYGLQGIRERAEILGGRMTAGPGAHGGFVLTVEVPS